MRIPIYTSRAQITGPQVVKPKADIAVSEAVGGLARTVGKVATDWANAKAQDTAQRELASSATNYKSKMSDYVIGVRDNPDYNKEWEADFNKFEKETRGGIEFTSQKAKQVAEQNFENYRIAYKTELAGIDRQKHISAAKIQINTDLDLAVKMLSKPDVDKILASANITLSKEAIKAERITRYYNIEVGQIQKALGININADLKEFKNVLPAEKNKLIKTAKDSARAEANRLKAERKEQEEIYFEQTNDDFSNKFRENSLTLPEVEASTLKTKGEGGKMYWRDRVTTKAADETNEKESDYIRKKFALETITELDIDKRQDKLTDADYKKFKTKYKKWEKDVIDGKHTSSIFMSSTNMFYEELDRLADNGTITMDEAKDAKLKLPEQLYDKAMSGEISEDKIPDYSEFLIGSYLQKESQIRRDASAFKKFIGFMGSNIPRIIRESRREKRVEELPTEAEFPTKEVKKETKEETIKIEGIPPENVTYYSDWLKKTGAIVNEKNIRYLYEQFK